MRFVNVGLFKNFLIMKEYVSVQSIKHFYCLASILTVAPVFNFMKNTCYSSKRYIFYSLLWCISGIGLTIFAFIGRLENSYAFMTIPTIFLDIVSLHLNAFVTIYVTIMLTIKRKKKFENFVDNLIKFDNKSNTPLLEKPRLEFYIKLILYHLLFISFCLSDTFMWNRRLGFRVMRYYLSRYIQYYQFITFSFLFYNYAKLIRDRFVHLNDILVNTVTVSNQLYLMHDAPQKDLIKKVEETSIKKIIDLHLLLCDCVNLFNEIFGTVVFLMCITIIVGLLQPINIAFSYAKTDLNSQTKTMDPDMIAVCIIWSFMFLVIYFLLQKFYAKFKQI